MSDISSDPVCGSFGCTLPKGHNMGKADIPANHQPRDISSVTGSAADELLSSLAATGDYLNTDLLDRKDIAKQVAAIQREAVDAFIRDELPGLLEATRTMHDPVTPTWATRRAEAIAKEVEQRAQTS